MLDLLARVATRVPSLTLGVLLAATVGFGVAAGALEVDTGLEGFAPEGGVAEQLDDLGDRFGTASSVQVLVDAGPGGDVLDRDLLAAVEELGERIEHDPIVAPVLQEERSGRPPVVTFAFPFAMAVGDDQDSLTDLAPATFELILDAVLEDAYDDISPMLAADLDTRRLRARSGLIQVAFDADTDSEDRRTASRRIGEIVESFDHPGIRAGAFSMVGIEDAIEASLERDMPMLLGVSLLLVLLVLAWLFRSVADVLVGFVGLLASIVWMAGLGALLGPRYLGVIGDFTQINVAVPVLLVGLGIDYSVHLTTRYREQRARGDLARDAARTAMTTVGFALVLATIASVAGFLANLATPLPPIRDFGILAAVGIVAAFVVLGGAVPATRTLIDRRADRRGSPRARRSPAARRLTGNDPLWVRVTTAVATRAPIPTLVGTAILLVAGVVAATGLSTEFDERDFLPSNEPVIATLDRLDAQFGGDVGERTYVLVDGDVTDAGLLAAASAFEADLEHVDGVRMAGERVEVVSPFFVVEMTARMGEQVRDRIRDELDAWADPEAAAAEVDLPDTIDEAFLGDDADEIDLPDDLEEALVRRLAPGRTPVGALLTAMDRDELEETIREAIADSYAQDRPGTLTDDDLAALLALPERALTRERLGTAGYPTSELDADDRDLLATLERLEEAGWAGRDDTTGEVWRDTIAEMRASEPHDVDGVVDGRGLLINIGTTGGQDHAERLAAELATLAAPVVAAGGEVTVISDALMQAEIISSLSAAQMQAILISLVAAALLLVAASLATSRSVGLGMIGIVPSTVALVFVLGSMRLIGIPFNALTATVASIAVGIGVPYGIHLLNRFRESYAHGLGPEEAIRDTLRNTGPALVGSAVTTGLAFSVLRMSEATPVVQFGRVSSLMIGYALLACVLVQPALLVLWARRRDAVAQRRHPSAASRGRA